MTGLSNVNKGFVKAVEAFFEKKGEQSEKIKAINALMEGCRVYEKGADEMYKTRHSMFRSGVHE